MAQSKRGGRGTNQYTVKPGSAQEDDALSRRISHMKANFAVPHAGFESYALDSDLARRLVIIQGGSDTEAQSSVQYIKGRYPEAYTRAVIDEPDDMIIEDVFGDRELEADEMSGILNRYGTQDAFGKMESEMASLSVIAHRSSYALDEHAPRINQLRNDMNVNRMQSIFG